MGRNGSSGSEQDKEKPLATGPFLHLRHELSTSLQRVGHNAVYVSTKKQSPCLAIFNSNEVKKKTACKVESVSVRDFLEQWHLAFRGKEYHNITPCSKCHTRGLLGRRTEWQLPLNGKGDSRGLGGGAGFYIILGA